MILNELFTLSELSPDTLASYKKKAGADASAADAAGNYARGNKRFKGIVKATKKQFATDTKGVAESRDYSAVTNAITRRIITQHPGVLAKYGPDVVGQAIDEIADFVGDVDEIGSSDVSGWTSQVIRSLARFAPLREQGVAEGAAKFDPKTGLPVGQQLSEFGGDATEFMPPTQSTPTTEQPPRRGYSIILTGKPGRDWMAEYAWQALEKVFPREYPGNSSVSNYSGDKTVTPAMRKVLEVANRGSAVAKTGITSEDIAETLVAKLAVNRVPAEYWRITSEDLDEEVDPSQQKIDQTQQRLLDRMGKRFGLAPGSSREQVQTAQQEYLDKNDPASAAQYRQNMANIEAGGTHAQNKPLTLAPRMAEGRDDRGFFNNVEQWHEAKSEIEHDDQWETPKYIVVKNNGKTVAKWSKADSYGWVDSSEQGVAEGTANHAELAKMAHDAYVAATRKGNGPMAAHYLKQHLKHKADAAKAKSGVAEAADPESQKFGKYIKKYFGQIYDYGDDGLEYLDNNAPFWAMLFDKHDGDIDYIIAMEPADVLKKAALELKAVAGDLKYELDEQGVAEDRVDQIAPGGADYSKHSTDELKAMLRPGIMGRNELKFKTLIRQELRKREQQGVAEGYNAEYDDEAGMANNNLETLARAVEGIDDLINTGDNLPEWCQEKIAVAKSMLVAVWDYMESEQESEEDDELQSMMKSAGIVRNI